MTTRTYHNFDLLITRTAGGYNARVVNAPAGQANHDFVLSFTQEEVRSVFWLSARMLRYLPPAAEHTPPALSARRFGERLFATLFTGSVGRCFAQSLLIANGQLRIRLRLGDVPELADLPWEFLYAPDLARHLALSAQTPLVRYFDLPLAEQALTVAPPLCILAVVADPVGVVKLDIEKEWQQLQTALAELQKRKLVTLERLATATPAALQARLRRRQAPVHVLHFIGHGDFDPAQEAGGLLLIDEHMDEHNQPFLLVAERLGALLHEHAALRLVFLNACEGARGGRTNALGGVAQTLVQQGAPAVVAMQFPIRERAAITLAQAFYQALAAGHPVDAALSEARKALYVAGSEWDWGTPVLFSRSPDNPLLVVDTPNVPAQLPPDTAVSPIHSGGGAVVQGNVTAGGDFVGRDQIMVVVQRPEDAVLLQQQQERMAALRDGTFARLPFEPETVFIPAGEFWMGSDTDNANEAPRHQVHLQDFRMGKYPVTNTQYAEFLARNPRQEEPKRAGWFVRKPPPAQTQHPVVSVSWHDATAYCCWLSTVTGRAYRLPTEAEWERAARGYDGRRYPWGDEWRDEAANVAGNAITPVTAYPAGTSVEGCLDLLGNVQEWTNTLWGVDINQCDYPYPYRGDDGREDTGVHRLHLRRIYRGGSFKNRATEIHCSSRSSADSDNAILWRGFRVVLEVT